MKFWKYSFVFQFR